jgi:valyl-tRNA synthetase
MPFLTEELWHQLPQKSGAQSIALDSFPVAKGAWQDARAAKEFGLVQDIIQSVRVIRSEMKLDPKKKVAGEFSSADARVRGVITANEDAIKRLAMLSELRVSSQTLPDGGGGMRSTAQFDLRIPYTAESMDVAAELARINKEIEGLRKAITSKQAQLGNEIFRSKAPEKIIQQMDQALGAQRVELEKLTDRLKQLGDG